MCVCEREREGECVCQCARTRRARARGARAFESLLSKYIAYIYNCTLNRICKCLVGANKAYEL